MFWGGKWLLEDFLLDHPVLPDALASRLFRLTFIGLIFVDQIKVETFNWLFRCPEVVHLGVKLQLTSCRSGCSETHEFLLNRDDV